MNDAPQPQDPGNAPFPEPPQPDFAPPPWSQTPYSAPPPPQNPGPYQSPYQPQQYAFRPRTPAGPPGPPPGYHPYPPPPMPPQGPGYGPRPYIPPPYGMPGYGYPQQPKRTSPVVYIGLVLFALSILGALVRSVNTFNPGSSPAPTSPPAITPPAIRNRPYEDFKIQPVDVWQTYKSGGGKYSVEFPGTPAVKSEPVPSAAGKMWIHTASYTLFEEYFESSYYDLDEPLASAKIDNYLRVEVGQLESYLSAKKVRDTPFDQRGFRGVEFQMTHTQTHKPIYGRVLYLPSRVYTLIATTGFDGRSAKVSRFLDSFKELETKPKVEPKTIARPRSDDAKNAPDPDAANKPTEVRPWETPRRNK